MKKIAYFLLGGFVATIGYIAGSMDSIIAEDESIVLKSLHIEDSLTVGKRLVVGKNANNFVHIMADDESSAIRVVHGHNKNGDDLSQVMILATTGENQPFSTIVLQDNLPSEHRINSYDEQDKAESSTNFARRNTSKPATADVPKAGYVVEVMYYQSGMVDNDLLLISADVKMPSGQKIHVVFTNPQTLGMFDIYDKIRIRKKGPKWEFIEHVP